MTAMISYSRSDWELVGPIVAFLRSQDIAVWVDRDEIRPNADWRRVLLLTPQKIDAFIPFLSRNYVASEMCRMELFLARSFDRPIFPVMLDECWGILDSKEETKYIAALYAARVGALKVVGFSVTRDEVLSRLVRAIRSRAAGISVPAHNTYISYPGSAQFAMQVYQTLSDETIRPWIATMHCEIGDDWRKAQVRGMAHAKAHVLVISEDLLNANDVLQTEILMAEALQLPTFCIKAPALASDEKVSDQVYRHVSNGAAAYRRLVQRQWYEPRHIGQELRADLTEILVTSRSNIVNEGVVRP